MGQTLSEPVTEKHTSEGGDDRLAYGASAMQGWRITMEDAHTTILDLGKNKKIAFFAVYDGHGGQSAAEFAGLELQRHVTETEYFKKGEYNHAIEEGYLSADLELSKMPKMQGDPSGCTAVCAMLTDDGTIYCGNAGDSRSVISTKGVVKELSFDHKPMNADEYERIVSGGGFVEFGRVNGNLALSRAIGDFEFKGNPDLPPQRQVVTAYPDVLKHNPSDDDEFVVIACDGIWDCMKNQEVVDFVRGQVCENIPLGKICENLMERCLAPESELGGVGCDNMTVVIVALLKNKTLEQWYQHIKDTPAAPIPEYYENESDDESNTKAEADSETPAKSESAEAEAAQQAQDAENKVDDKETEAEKPAADAHSTSDSTEDASKSDSQTKTEN